VESVEHLLFVSMHRHPPRMPSYPLDQEIKSLPSVP
jgi:hypothetical protein